MKRICFQVTLVALGIASTFFLSPPKASAQATGTISGYVTDPSGAAVPQAEVTAMLVEQGSTSTTQSNAQGFYNFPTVKPGTYSFTVTKSGFKKLTRTGVSLTVNQNVRLDLNLELGSVSQSVNVSGQAPLVDTTSATMSGLVDDRRVVDLPLNGRNVLSLAQIIPGVLNVYAPQQISSTTNGPRMDVNGGRPNMNAFVFDGGYFSDPGRNTGINYPPPDAIQEFRILTDNFTAEYGNNPGSQVIVVSKAGTNQFHGDVWEFLRNDALNARNFFSTTVPSLKQNQFGAAAGGPIKKDKLFFFGSYQGLRVRPQAVPSVALVPSEAERGGDFTSLLPTTVLTDPVDPLTNQPFTDSNGNSCLTANIINPNCISPVAKNLLQFVPLSPTGQVTSLGASPSNGNMYFGRIDWNRSSKHQLFGHFFLDHNTGTSAFASGGNIAGYDGVQNTVRTVMVTVNDTYTFSPSLVNQAAVSYLRTTSDEADTKTVDPSSIGINMPQYVPTGTVDMNVGGNFDLGAGFTTHLIANNYQFRDVLTWMKGRHNFKFGGEFERHHTRLIFIGPPGFDFSGSRSGNAVADFLLGAYTSLNLDFGVRDDNRFMNEPKLFFQDEFKATQRLTLNFGVRYEPFLQWISTQDRINTVVYGQQSVKVPDAPPGIVFPGDLGVPRGLAPARWNKFAPRFGFAWDVFGDGKTSVRGGYGVFFETVNGDSLSQENPPYAGFASAFNGLVSDPFGSTGQAAPPAALTGNFGCVKVSAPPGVDCPLFPLPVGGQFTDRSLTSPYIQSWNLDIQRQVTPSTMVDVAYVGKIGTKVESLRNYNPGEFIPGTTYDPTTGFENTLTTPDNVNQRVLFEPGILGPQGYMLGNDFRSWYHSLQAQVTRRFNNGLSLVAAYTLSKSIDSSSTYTLGATVSDPFNLSAERGRSDWDRHHAFVASWLYSPQIKFDQHWMNSAFAGWTFTGILSLQSGPPITFLSGPDVAVDGTSDQQHAFVNGQPIGLGQPNRGAMVKEFFNTSAFVNPTCGFTPQPGNPLVIEQENCAPFGIKYSLLGQYGNSGRGILSGPAFSNTDFAAIKNFSFTDRYRLQFRSEFFNTFNQVDFSNPDRTVTDGSFGRLRGANSARVVQFALKFLW
jgi:Carboxypeptidase regulatory-like domain